MAARFNWGSNKNQLKTVQKIEHNLAYMDYAKIFCLQFYWLLVLKPCGTAGIKKLPAEKQTAFIIIQDALY